MSTCKDCLYGDNCSICEVMGDDFCCVGFKDRSKFVELPCKVGDTVYHLLRTGVITKRKVEKYILTSSEGLCYILDNNEIYPCFWKSIFLTKEEAEQALAERGVDNG